MQIIQNVINAQKAPIEDKEQGAVSVLNVLQERINLKKGEHTATPVNKVASRRSEGKKLATSAGLGVIARILLMIHVVVASHPVHVEHLMIELGKPMQPHAFHVRQVHFQTINSVLYYVLNAHTPLAVNKIVARALSAPKAST